VLDKKFKKLYALKEISKVKVIDKKSINSIIYERELLSRLKHSLIINLQYAFQDYNNLYLVLDLLTGGDLRYQIGHHQRQYFSEHQTKFFISCIIESLLYIHSKNIMHSRKYQKLK
jgi:serine/threonine protein kinase